MTEIPKFSFDESEAIGALFDEAAIPFERQGRAATARENAGFLFSVPDDRLAEAIQAIKSYYGFLDTPPEAVNGTCPACNASVNNAFECPDCGLSLSFDSRGLMRNHPFTVFLDKLEQTGKQAGS